MPAAFPGMAQKVEKSEEDVQFLQQENADSKERPWRDEHSSRIFLMSG